MGTLRRGIRTKRWKERLLQESCRMPSGNTVDGERVQNTTKEIRTCGGLKISRTVWKQLDGRLPDLKLPTPQSVIEHGNGSPIPNQLKCLGQCPAVLGMLPLFYT